MIRSPIKCLKYSVAALALAATSAQAQSEPGYWDFETPSDNYSGGALMDMSFLNEDVAGQNGWVRQVGDSFIRDDGKKIRFWTVNLGPQGSEDGVRQQAKFLAKRGVNMARWHSSLFNNNAASYEAFRTPNASNISQLQRFINGTKSEGIYTKVSFFFILGLRINANMGIDGYDSTWIAANSTFANEAPFGLIFFDQKFKNAYKNWLTVLLDTSTNGGKTVATDPAVAIIEIQNEDNLFFYTWNPARFPEIQQQRIFKQFGDFLVEKHGSLDAAYAAWGANAAFAKDDVANGRMEVTNAQGMTVNLSGGRALRMADQIEFLAKVQYDFHAEMRDLIRSKGYEGAITATNWQTANAKLLGDTEYWTYTAAGTQDEHNYYSELGGYGNADFTKMSGGDQYYGVPMVNNPRGAPATYKHMEGYASFISELAWNAPTDYRVEAPSFVGAYSALTDIDGITWFAHGTLNWQNTGDSWRTTWAVGVPGILGMFPASSIIYRESYVAPAPAVVREGRTLESLWKRETPLINVVSGWDPARDPNGQYNYDPEANSGTMDTIAAYLGRVDLAFDMDDDFVYPGLFDNYDSENNIARSVTGELTLNLGVYPYKVTAKDAENIPTAWEDGRGHLVIDAPRAQGATGWLDIAGNVNTADLTIRFRQEFGSVVVVPLDGRPINQSSKLLVQHMGRDRPKGYTTSRFVHRIGTTDYAAKQIATLGEMPWLLEDMTGNLTLKGIPDSRIVSVQPTDVNGYASGSPITGSSTSAGYRFNLPSKNIYTVITLNPLTDYTPVVVTKALQNGWVGDSFEEKVHAVSGDGAVTFSATGLPSGLSIAADGTVSGTPTSGGLYKINVTVTDADGDSSTQEVLHFIIGGQAAICSVMDDDRFWVNYDGGFTYGLNYNTFFYNGYCPFLYDFGTSNWWYTVGDDPEGFFAYNFVDSKWYFFLSGYMLSLDTE